MITFKYGEAVVWAVRDPERARIIKLLANRCVTVADIELELGIPLFRVLSHIEVLVGVSIVDRKAGAAGEPLYTISGSMMPLIANYLAISSVQERATFSRGAN